MRNFANALRRLAATCLFVSFTGIIPATAADGLFCGGSSPKALQRSETFRHLDAGISLGTTGLGINLSTGICANVRLRAGFDFIPSFSVPMSFGLDSYTDQGITGSNFGSMQSYMKRITGVEVDDRVEMDGKPTMNNFKLIFDVYPWADKGWRVSAGFYYGRRKVAKAINTMGEMPSLLAVNIYNNFYNYFMTGDPYEPIFGSPDDPDAIYIDPDLFDRMQGEMRERGMMGIHIGDFKDGRPYMMKPDKDGMVKASAFVNAFRPYVGLGYTGPVSKDGRWNFDVDCGLMMWGGSPKIVTHDGTNLTDDVTDIKGKPGRYVRMMKHFKVYPVVSIAISCRLF